MVTRSETGERAGGEQVAPSCWRGRLWRYAPLACWIGFIFFASTGAMSASNTSRIIAPLFKWLFPAITEAQLLLVHFAVRKTAHFAEYAVLALLAARAFIPSARSVLRRRWFVAALALVVCVALLDEYNQSFNPARTGTIWDSLIDMSGGATALVVFNLWRAWRRGRRKISRAGQIGGENFGKRSHAASAYNRGITSNCGERISMRESQSEAERELSEEDARWYGVYLGVIAFTVLVIAALWFFSRWFSS